MSLHVPFLCQYWVYCDDVVSSYFGILLLLLLLLLFLYLGLSPLICSNGIWFANSNFFSGIVRFFGQEMSQLFVEVYIKETPMRGIQNCDPSVWNKQERGRGQMTQTFLIFLFFPSSSSSSSSIWIFTFCFYGVNSCIKEQNLLWLLYTTL